MRRLIALQLQSGRPPEVRVAFDRLRAMGQTSGHARRLIRVVLANEIRAMMRERRVFDNADFARRLGLLPDEAAFAPPEVSGRD